MLLGPPCTAWRRRSMTPLLEALATEPFPPQHEPQPRMRASDADREAVVQTLLDAIARGLLTLQEGDERVAAAYAARFLDELPGLTADLPPAPADAPAAPPGGAPWRSWPGSSCAPPSPTSGVAPVGAVRFRPRLAIAVVALLALLSLVAATTGAGVGSHDHGHGAYGGDGWHDHDHDPGTTTTEPGLSSAAGLALPTGPGVRGRSPPGCRAAGRRPPPGAAGRPAGTASGSDCRRRAGRRPRGRG